MIETKEGHFAGCEARSGFKLVDLGKLGRIGICYRYVEMMFCRY